MRVLLASFLLASLSQLPLFAQAPGEPEFSQRYLRVAMQIDEEAVPSNLLLELPHADWQRPFAQLNPDDGTDAQRLFAGLVQAMAEGDTESLVASHNRQGPDGTPSRELAALFIQGFADSWDSMQVTGLYDLGTEVDVAWEIEVEDTRFRRITRISKKRADLQAGQFWLEEMEPVQLTALQNVLAEAEQLLLEERSEPVPAAEALALAYRREIPLVDGFWRFDGQAGSWDAFAKDKPADIFDHPAAEAFWRAQQDLTSGEATRYAAHFTPLSAQKLIAWARSLPAGGYADYVRDMQAMGCHVVFLLKADPVFLVFYETSDGQVRTQTVYREPESGDYKLASFYMEGIFDSLLKDENFFFGPVLLPLFRGELAGPAPLPATAEDEEPDSANAPAQAARAGESGFIEPLPESEEDQTKEQADPSSPSPLVPVLIGLLLLAFLIILSLLLKKSKQ
ncbi:hypothetical protein [Roseibacillus ishigakijimensis]|uniref:Uncharacterized protein n=1 Tax=Roseibacillus ishigakijimensis TaxID=454146 RepID=A0A934RRH7_9BACT|nr:hypothetical protein [Roseibacillus ishigakijimensis]MBK1833196.1 hypothetical protein [Roseibacillus ishigakijimensis]